MGNSHAPAPQVAGSTRRRGASRGLAPELQRLLGAVHTSQAAMDGLVSVIAGTVPVPEFFGPENTERIMAGAASGTSRAT